MKKGLLLTGKDFIRALLQSYSRKTFLSLQPHLAIPLHLKEVRRATKEETLVEVISQRHRSTKRLRFNGKIIDCLNPPSPNTHTPLTITSTGF